MELIRMKAPPTACGFSCADVSYTVDNGYIFVCPAHVDVAKRHGFTEAPIPARASTITRLQRKA